MKSFMTFITLFILFAVSLNAVDYDATKQNSGVFTVLEGNSATLTLDGVTEYTLTIERVSGRSIVANVDGRALNLDIGQEREYDLNNDGVNDVYIILNNVIDRLVSFKVQELVSPTTAVEDTTSEDTTSDVNVEDTANNEVTGAVVGTSSGLSKWVIGGIILVVIIIILAFVMSGNGNESEKLYDKAKDLHREGQEFHYDGDDDTAGELYDKADELREKARNKEGGF